MSGTLENSGHSVLFRPASGNFFPVNVSGGPLAYNYPVQSVNLHFGMDDETGSEHLVAGSSFVGEVGHRHLVRFHRRWDEGRHDRVQQQLVLSFAPRSDRR